MSSAIGRTLRVLSKYIPLEYETFEVVLTETGLPITSVKVKRQEVEQIIDAPNAEIISLKLAEISHSDRNIENAIVIKINIEIMIGTYPLIIDFICLIQIDHYIMI